jgi:hypothetical protein
MTVQGIETQREIKIIRDYISQPHCGSIAIRQSDPLDRHGGHYDLISLDAAGGDPGINFAAGEAAGRSLGEGQAWPQASKQEKGTD